MKYILSIFLVMTSLNTFAINDKYQFDGMQRADDFNFSEILANKEWTILVFNNGYCPMMDSKMDCFPFEMKLNYFSQNIYKRNGNLQIVNIDMQTTSIKNQFDIKSPRTTLFLLNGAEMMRFEKTKDPNLLVQEVLAGVFKIPETN